MMATSKPSAEQQGQQGGQASSFFVGRQPILDPQGRTHGYELLYRHAADAQIADFVDGEAATARVLVNALTEIGLDALIGERRGFINLTQRYFENTDLLNSLPADRLVLEVLEDVQPTPEVLAAITSLTEQGFLLAADDFVYAAECESLLAHMTYVKYVFGVLPDEEMATHIARDHTAGRLVVLERIETAEEFARGCALGADYFQGYYFARPTTIGATAVAPNTATVLELLGRVTDPKAGLMDIADVLSHDVSLSVRALRFVNSAGIGLDRPVDSIAHAASLIGRDKLRSWAGLALMASMGDHPDELGIMMLSRARACSLFATELGTADPDRAYTVGMLSLVDVMTGNDMASVLASMPVGAEVRSALLDGNGPLHDILQTVRHIEAAELGVAISPALVDLYFGAVGWASQFRAKVGKNV